MSDLGLVIAYRVRNPTQPEPPALADALNNLQFLSSAELLDVMVTTLSSSFVRGIESPTSKVKDPFDSGRGR